ncbi:MAG: bifunctional UDP-sugar hydrolase/5'-nucleotidase [Beijerinckiaceae bacterium]|nr:bifunctional UDP-sugar hydrolase/5'-nucleotidase [Beijerinckiaceae bacterium]
MRLSIARLVTSVFACFIVSLAASAQDKPAENRVTFVVVSDVYKMNAVNGRGGYARIAGAINQERARGGTVLVVHAGDALSPCLMCAFDSGEHVIDIMNRMGFDMFVPGNHEYDFGKETYLKRMGEAKFPVFAANLRGADGRVLPGHRDEMIIDQGGVRIAIIGLTAQDSHEKSNPGDLRIAPVQETLEERAKELRAQGADMIVAVVHADRNIDTRLYDLGIADVILSGDDHDFRYIYNRRSVLIEGGEDGTYVIALDVVLGQKPKADERLVWNPRVRVIDTADVTPDPAVAERVAYYEGLLSQELDVELATLGEPLDSRSAVVRGGEAAWGNLIADAIRSAAHADIGIMNGGGIRGGARYEAGARLTRRHVLSELPFGNATLMFRLTGAQLRTTFEHGYADLPRPAGHFLHISGAQVIVDTSRKSGERVASITIGGKPLDEKTYYSVAASDFFLRGGDGYTEFNNETLRTRVEDAQLIANDVMVHARRLSQIRAKPEGRILVK